MDKNKLGAAVVGLRMGAAHVEGFLRNTHTRLVAVCDTDPQKLSDFQKRHGVMGVSDYRELLDNREIDVVAVATPDYVHAEQSIAFLRAGKHVLCEKPMTLDLEESRRIIGAVKETGSRFMVGQVGRFAPGFVLAKRMVERGEIGELFLVESEYAHNYGHAPGVNNWRKDPRREPFIGGGCHAVDLLRWIAGEAEEVFAYANHKCLTGWPVNDCTVAVFKFEKNIIGKVMVSIGCVRPYTMRSVFYGTQGTIVCDNTSSHIQVCSQKNLSGKPEFASFPVDIANHNVGAEINEFVDAVLNNTRISTDAISGARSVAACVAAVQSAASGKPMKIEAI